VPVPVAPERPAVEPVPVATLTLRRGSAPADVRVKPGTYDYFRLEEPNRRARVIVSE
jgi:hypothetical protein